MISSLFITAVRHFLIIIRKKTIKLLTNDNSFRYIIRKLSNNNNSEAEVPRGKSRGGDPEEEIPKEVNTERGSP
jgi:hypothetical protein